MEKQDSIFSYDAIQTETAPADQTAEPINRMKILQKKKKRFIALISSPFGGLLSSLGKLQSILWLRTDVVFCANIYRLEAKKNRPQSNGIIIKGSSLSFHCQFDTHLGATRATFF